MNKGKGAVHGRGSGGGGGCGLVVRVVQVVRATGHEAVLHRHHGVVDAVSGGGGGGELDVVGLLLGVTPVHAVEVPQALLVQQAHHAHAALGLEADGRHVQLVGQEDAAG